MKTDENWTLERVASELYQERSYDEEKALDRFLSSIMTPYPISDDLLQKMCEGEKRCPSYISKA